VSEKSCYDHQSERDVDSRVQIEHGLRPADAPKAVAAKADAIVNRVLNEVKNTDSCRLSQYAFEPVVIDLTEGREPKQDTKGGNDPEWHGGSTDCNCAVHLGVCGQPKARRPREIVMFTIMPSDSHVLTVNATTPMVPAGPGKPPTAMYKGPPGLLRLSIQDC
jgi:hypothetical protein